MANGWRVSIKKCMIVCCVVAGISAVGAFQIDKSAPGEPSISGLFTRDMKPKTSYHAMNQLINETWKTRAQVKTDADGRISFCGKCRLFWKGADGKPVTRVVVLK